MGRSATNAVGNSIASAVVAKWDGELMSESEARAHAAHLDAEPERQNVDSAYGAGRATSVQVSAASSMHAASTIAAALPGAEPSSCGA